MSSTIGFPTHDVTALIGDTQIEVLLSYEIRTSMIEPAAHFHFSIPYDDDAWILTKPDAPIQISIDDTIVLVGFVDQHSVPDNNKDGDVIEVTGRNKYGRVIDESAPSINYANLTMQALVEQLADPWYTSVSFSNVRNRRLMRGRGKKARAGDEPLVIFSKKKFGTRITPGQSRHHVIEELCAQAGCLIFPSADGAELFIGQPNYEQEPQFQFFMPMASSSRTSESTVNGMAITESVAERYSRIIVVGSGTGTDVNYGATVASRYAQVLNNPGSEDGTGIDFTQPKRLIAVRPVNSIQEAQELAVREMARRDAHGLLVSVRAAGHGQIVAGTQTTIFAPDTLALVEDERTGTQGTFAVTDCVYRGQRGAGQETALELVPKGTVLIS